MATYQPLVIVIYLLDKFDQFWAVNRRLMEVPTNVTAIGEAGNNREFSQAPNCFKHIPIRFYEGDKSMIQKLIKPTVNAINTRLSPKEVSKAKNSFSLPRSYISSFWIYCYCHYFLRVQMNRPRHQKKTVNLSRPLIRNRVNMTKLKQSN